MRCFSQTLDVSENYNSCFACLSSLMLLNAVFSWNYSSQTSVYLSRYFCFKNYLKKLFFISNNFMHMILCLEFMVTDLMCLSK